MNPASDRGACVLWVASAIMEKGLAIKAHDHEYYHLFFVKKGPVSFQIDTSHETLQNNEFILIPPGMLHGMDKVTEAYINNLEIKFVVQSNRVRRQLETIPQLFREDSFATGLIEQIVEVCSQTDPSAPEIGADYLLTLLNYLYRKYGVAGEEQARFIDTTGYSPLSQEIVKYLEKNYPHDIPLQQVADAVGFNKNYICSVFKKDSGMTIGNCLTLIRIRKAAEYISFSDMNLQQVAAATGFTNFSHFNRIFKKVVGIPPGQYRCMYTTDMLTYSADYANNLRNMPGFIAAVMGGKRLSREEMPKVLPRLSNE